MPQRLTINAEAPLLRRLGLDTLAGVRAFRGARVKDHHGRRDVLRIEVQDPAGAWRVWFLKRTWRPYLKDGLTSLWRRGAVWSVSHCEAEHARVLERAGFLTPRCLAWGEEVGLLREKFSFLLTESAPGVPLSDFLARCRERARRQCVLDALARGLRRFHDAGLATPDLFTRHIFVETVGEGPPKFWFIDMARLDVRGRVSLRRRARDLAALNVTAPPGLVSARERVRFLKVYAGRLDKALARRIARRMEHLLRRRRFQDFFRNNEPNVK
ncbi:MAG: lipopolysaccharide kinase InaA family protein [Verrucomicrobiales bacterium]|nr:lipopolysaccharide kinase InaA family protein [Verrucomicrobiales bacterium]